MREYAQSRPRRACLPEQHAWPPGGGVPCLQGTVAARRTKRLMHLILVGLSHKTAPIEIREKLTFPETRQGEALARLNAHDDVAEAVILGRDDISWGPNNTFQFPKHGGTGAIWRALRCSERLPARDRIGAVQASAGHA